MAIVNITKEVFESKVRNSDVTVLLDFYAEWCGPCKMVAPIIHEIAEEKPDILVAKVDVDAQTDMAIEFGVSSIPTLIVFKNNKVINKAVGFRSKEQILKLLEE